MVLFMFILSAQKVQISQRSGETNQHGDDSDKGACSVSNILLEHGVFVSAQIYRFGVNY